MIVLYEKTCGRFKIKTTENGTVWLDVPNGWNEHVGHTTVDIQIDELHDLKFLIDRALAAYK